MGTAFPILFPLLSAAEVVVAERAVLEFRARAGNQTEAIDLSKIDYSKLTHAEKLTEITKEWTVDALREIKPWVLHNDTVLAMLDLCAASPGAWITFRLASDAAQMENSQGRGQLQALTKKTRNHMGKRSWPVVVNATPPGVTGLGYFMSKEIADRWKLVRAEP
jgi:hypothetical protein